MKKQKIYLRLEPEDNRVEIKMCFLPNRDDIFYYKGIRYLIETKVFDNNSIDIYCLLDQ